jgi:hypothetical protein
LTPVDGKPIDSPHSDFSPPFSARFVVRYSQFTRFGENLFTTKGLARQSRHQSMITLDSGKGRGENFSSFSFLRDLCASARELGGRKMLLKKQSLSGERYSEHEVLKQRTSGFFLRALRVLRGENWLADGCAVTLREHGRAAWLRSGQGMAAAITACPYC